MADSTATLALVIKAKDMASGQVNKLSGSFKQLKTGALDGLPLGFMGAAGAAALLTNALANAVQGAIEEEASIKRMTAALEANIPGWDGNTAAVDRAISKAMEFAFADDDVRDSLTKLVPVTHSVEKAMRLQAVAMDLARLKGVSLTEASQALVDIEGGRYRALGKLIGATKDITSETEALAEVQKVAAGQAEAYMDTVAGKTEALTNKWNDLQEEVGARVVPAVDGFVSSMLDAIRVIEGSEVPIQDLTSDLVFISETLHLPWADALKGLSDLEYKMAIAAKATTDGRIALTNYKLEEWKAEQATLRLADASNELSYEMQHIPRRVAPATDAFKDLNDTLYTTLDYASRLGLIGHASRLVANPRKEARRIARMTGAAVKGNAPGSAGGGWVGVNGPEVITVGERGPEYVSRNDELGSPMRGMGGGVMLQGVSERELMDMIDRGLYFRLRRAGTAA